eukprot:g16460.t1
MMKTPNRWLGLLGAAVIASAIGASAYSTSSTGCYELWVGDGFCDNRNNNELCDYDGGDCCECTCQSEADDDRRCNDSFNEYACVDPAAPCVDDDDITIDIVENCDYPQGIGNGWCDLGNNNAACDYDGGDCCKCTCIPPPASAGDDDYACTDDINFFACVDPDAACVDDDDITVDILENCGRPGSIGDGFCDQENNKAECSYDGGDCCECTCMRQNSSDDRACTNDVGFACIDPDAPCSEDDDITPDMVENCSNAQSIGDGWCDLGNNKPECLYDGGDCCECTCDTGTDFDDDYRCNELTGFACIDPEAPCMDDDGVTADMLEDCGSPILIGNGRCNEDNNLPECNFDGGDCCSCTCVGDCLEFACVDPDAECFVDDSATMDSDTDDYPTSYDFDFGDDDLTSYDFEQEEPFPDVLGAVEVGTKTEVGVTATAHDVRPGASSGMVGCGEEGGDGCAPANTRDGIVSDIESRWSCATKLLEGEGPCQIQYTFAEPQDVVDIQVAFWKGDERLRTLDVHLNGELTHTRQSYSGSTYNTLGVAGNAVTTVTLESIGLMSNEWISLIEVLIFVTP